MGNTGSFAQYRLDLLDPRNGGPEGTAWAQALGGAQDQEMSLLRTAALSRLPQLCPDDALDVLGPGAFGLPRNPGQTNASYRQTLAQAPQTYTKAGSAQAVIDELTAYAGGSLDVAILRDCDGQTDYASEWYARFDVELGPNFGTLAVQQAGIQVPLATTTALFQVPAVGAEVTIAVDTAAFQNGKVVYIGQAGYYQVADASGGTSVVFLNLGGAPQACAVLGLNPGMLGTAANMAAPGTHVAQGQQIVIATYAISVDLANPTESMIIGQTLIGIQFAVPAQRRAVKNIILRWKAAHGYAARIQLKPYPGTFIVTPEFGALYYWDFTYLGNMIGVNMQIGPSPDDSGYDRS